MVATDMVKHRLIRDLENIVLQLLQVMDPHDLLMRLWVTEDEIPEPHVLLQDMAEIDVHGLRVLVNEPESLLFRFSPVLRLRAFHDQGDVFVLRSDGLQQLDSSLRVLYSLDWEPGIADHPKSMVGILMVQFHRLLIVTCQDHLRAPSHTHGGRMAIQGLRGKALALHEDIAVQIRQDRTIEPDAVLHQKDHLDAHLLHIML